MFINRFKLKTITSIEGSSIVSIFYIFLVIVLSGSITLNSAYSQTPPKHAHEEPVHHRFNDADRWARVFEDTSRDAWQKPDAVIAAMGLESKSLVADIGSATGYFPVRFARIAKEGRVYGIDIEPNMIRYLNERAQKEGLVNLKSVLGSYDDPKIPEPVDFIFICDTYHHLQQRKQYFENLKKYFRGIGILVIVDFKKGDLPVGPPDSAKLSEEQVINELTSAGYSLIPSNFSLPYQYFLRFKLNKEGFVLIID